MTPEANQPGPKKSIAWQLLQIAALAALLVAGMYEVDRDARALAERRARPALLLAVEEAARRGPSAGVAPDLERAVEVYATVCTECASVEHCQDAIRTIRDERKLPAGRGPCKPGIFERWSAAETDGTPPAR